MTKGLLSSPSKSQHSGSPREAEGRPGSAALCATRTVADTVTNPVRVRDRDDKKALTPAERH